MAQSLITKSGPNGPFVYIENNIANSLAFGADDANAVYTLNTSATANVIPAQASANIIFDPTANGNLTFKPNGSGKINALNVAGGTVSNKNYVTINTSTGELGSDTMSVSFMWNEVTGTSAAMAINNGYIANNGALVTLTLPATAVLGSVIEVCGKGAGGWSIAQNSGQTIHYGASNTTTGAGGSLASTLQYDAVRMVCTTANTDFVVLSSVGNLTVV
jgi:hypothetical protein